MAKKTAVKKTFTIRDEHDRFFTLVEHGFDLTLKAGVPQQVDAKIASIIKKKFSYISIS